MTRYALFFDIDGTLVSFKTHEIPPSTILALTQAKANGHRIFIATGRPPIIITNLGAINHLIDGFVTTNGALCYVGDNIVRCEVIPHESACLVVADAKEKHYGLIVVGERDIAVLDPKGEVDQIFRKEIAVKNLDLERPVDEVLQQPILQLTPFFTADYEAELMQRIPNCVSGRWHPAFTDITAIKADKGQGILAMAAYEGFNPQHTLAFGDGGNDTSMILTAGIGIAMGNALDTLKQQADYVRGFNFIFVLRLEGVALIGFVSFTIFLHVNLQITEVTCFLNLHQILLGLLFLEVFLGCSQVVGKLELFLLCVQN